MADPKDVHRQDQAFASLTEAAAMVAHYYLQLKEHGLDADEAWALTCDFHARMMGDDYDTEEYGNDEGHGVWFDYDD